MTSNLTDNVTSKITNKATISTTIDQVCATKNITCLHAIESGSRAWGFASTDSDFDVRLIYAREPNWYLRLFDGKDTFEYIEDDLFEVPFDIGGWDIKKALKLIFKSNAVIFEWLNSPIIYQQDNEAMTQLKAISQPYFNPVAGFHHYKGMATTASATLDLTQPIKLKKLFYVLRALLACRWIQAHKSAPPVVMNDMLELLDTQEQHEIVNLIALKKQVDESHRQPIAPILKRCMETLWQDIQNPEFAPRQRQDVTPLNEFYRQVVFNR